MSLPTPVEPTVSVQPAAPTQKLLQPLRVPYLLVLFPVPFVRDAAGRLSIDPLWAKDLVEHTRYLPQLTLVSYMTSAPQAPEGWIVLKDDPCLQRVRCVGVPKPRSTWHAIYSLPQVVSTLWRELGRHAVVHSGFSWPIGEAWLITPMLWFRKRFHLVVVESATWRLIPGERASFKRRLRARVSEAMNRFCCNRVDMAIFTQAGYLDSLRTRERSKAHVIEASWIDSDLIIDAPELALTAARRGSAAGRALQIVFAGRLTAGKGIALLVDVVAGLVGAGQGIELDVFGEGELLDSLNERIAKRSMNGSIRMRGTVPYGRAFLSALRAFDVLVVPSLSDEQPRIVYDAYSQALPVIASDTAGLRQCVSEGSTGWLFAANDDRALGDRLSALCADRSALLTMSENCVTKARGMTHAEMHMRRWRLLQAALAPA